MSPVHAVTLAASPIVDPRWLRRPTSRVVEVVRDHLGLLPLAMPMSMKYWIAICWVTPASKQNCFSFFTRHALLRNDTTTKSGFFFAAIPKR